MIQDTVHSKICKNRDRVSEWFLAHRSKIELPFYTSVDVRDSGFKVGAVDANIYPAGFNNICSVDKEESHELVRYYIKHMYGTAISSIAILAEENSRNPFYWENMKWIKSMIEGAGFQVRVCLPRDYTTSFLFDSASGEKIEASPFQKENGKLVGFDGFIPDVIISNNDFSTAYEEWARDIKIPINPPRELGWHQRKKSDHFKHYNLLASEFAELLGLDPWYFTVPTEVYSQFQVDDLDSREQLALRVESLLEQIKKKYAEKNISSKPTVFVKNNSGTYGLGVMSVQSGDDIRMMNSKSRGKMNAAKGGREVSEVILQEGIPSILISGNEVAEPVIYIVGCQLAGGFFRTHSNKGPDDSLNSPGAVFKKMCVSDLKVDIGEHPIENVYGWMAKIASLAIGYEALDLHLKFKTEPNP